MVIINGRKLERPAIVCDTDEYVVMKIGEYEDMQEFYKVARKALSSVNYKELNNKLKLMRLPNLNKPLERSIELIELPLNQEVVDNIFYNSGYLRNYLDRVVGDNVVKVNFEPIE